MQRSKNLRNLIYSAILALFFMSASMAYAQSPAGSANIQTLIQQLQEQIKTLQSKLETLRQAQLAVKEVRQDVKDTVKLLRELREGMTGEDVKTLQSILAVDPDIYPEGLITGFYGRLTAKAVRKFQERHELETVGNVGPKTLKKLGELVEKNAKAFRKVDKILDKLEGILAPEVLNSTTTPRGEKVTICHIPPGNPSARHTITIGSPALKAHLKHGDAAGACAGGTPPPGTGTTTPDITAPAISFLTSSNISSTSATAGWTTDESATSKVYYSLTSPVNLSSASSVSDGSFVVSHSLNLAGLTASSTYYFVAESKDSAGNTATSSQQSFTTLP